jgi:hypothetical protein
MSSIRQPSRRGPVVGVVLLLAGCAQQSAPENVTQTRSALLGSASLRLEVLTNSCGQNQMQDFFRVVNTGTTAVKLSDIKIKLWAYDTSGQAVVPHVWTGGCITNVNGNPSCVHQVTGVTPAAATFSPACGPDADHQANWEVTISNTDETVLPPGATWDNLQSALNLADYSNFTPGTGKWFSPCLTGGTYVEDPHFALEYQGAMVFAGGINAPDCRAPHGTQPITSYTPPPPSTAAGAAPNDKVIFLAVGLPIRNLAALQSFVQQASDPASPTYLQYKTPADILADHSPPTADYDALVAWAQVRNLTVGTHPNRLVADVSGTVADIERAFYANVILAFRPDGSQYYRLDRQPSVDFAVQLLGVSGLDNFVPSKALAGTAPIPGTFQSSDLRGAYLGVNNSCTALNGAGQTIGILSDTGFTPSDITTYQANTGLTGVPPVQVQVSNDPFGVAPTLAPPLPVTGNLETWEISLDIAMAMAMAPAAQVIVFEGRNADSILTNMTNNPQVGQFSTSFLAGASALTTNLITVIAAQGQSFITGSGDWGAFQPPTVTCPPANLQAIMNRTVTRTEFNPNINDYRALPFVTVMGGTVLSTSGGLWSGEVAWPLTGGGILTNAPIPAYQVGLNATNAEVSTTNRNLPDLSLVADGLYIVTTDCNGTSPASFTGDVINGMTITPCPEGQLTPGMQHSVGGTSASAPLFAGMMALVNQQSMALGRGRVGWANPAIYNLAKNPAIYPRAFNDVTTGTVVNTCGFAHTTQAGYDLNTGWGTPKCDFVHALAGRPLGRHLDISGTLTQLVQNVSSCPPCNSLLQHQDFDFHMALTPDNLVETRNFERCVDNDVKARINFRATLSSVDFATVQICVRQGMYHSYGPFSANACEEAVDLSSFLCRDLPVGASIGFNDGGGLDTVIEDSHAYALWFANATNND